MKNSIRVIIYICIITFFSACGLKTTSLEINQYAIDFKLKTKEFSTTLDDVYIEKIDVNRIFDNRSIYYRSKKYQYEEYVLNRWMNKPSKMIYKSIFEAIESVNIFKNVLKEKRKDDSTYVLKTELIDIYNSVEKDKSYAILKIKFYLQKNKNNLIKYSYDKKVLNTTNTPYGFVVAANEGLLEAVNNLILKIEKIK